MMNLLPFDLPSTVAAIPLALASICSLTYAITLIQYHLTLRHNARPSTKDIRPAVVPYFIPWLGSSLRFLTPIPGHFYESIFTFHDRSIGYFGAVLGGETNHIVYSSRAVQALFKVKSQVAHREHLNEMVLTKTLDLSGKDYKNMSVGGREAKNRRDEEMNQELLLRQSAVNELTKTYIEFLRPKLQAFKQTNMAGKLDGQGGMSLGFYKWLQTHMFGPSVKAFLGERMEHMYDGFEQDFWKFDNGMLDMLFGVPKLFQPEPYQVRDRLLEHITRWVEEGDKLLAADMTRKNAGSSLPDPHDPEQEWEPIWGSRLQRARQARWISEGITKRGRAGMELGFLFGLNSNVIPATGWMMMHILDPKRPDLLPRVIAEVDKAVLQRGDNIEDIELDINILIAQPLLMALYQEVLRLYVDVLVARKAEQDLRLPLDGDMHGKEQMLYVKKGETVITPNFVSQRDPTFFDSPPVHVFDPDRFLVPATSADGGIDDKGGYSFSTAATAHKLWPYGGGKTICPGRVFAKQEILATVAILLVAFDIAPVEPGRYQLPGFAKVYGGSGTIPPKGDVQVHVRPRKAE